MNFSDVDHNACGYQESPLDALLECLRIVVDSVQRVNMRQRGDRELDDIRGPFWLCYFPGQNTLDEYGSDWVEYFPEGHPENRETV